MPPFKNYPGKILLAVFSLVSILILSQTNFAQSSDPDKPTSLTKSVVNGSSSGGLSDEKTYYYAFDVKPGTLTLTLDIVPLNKSDGSGLVQFGRLSFRSSKCGRNLRSAGDQ